MQWVQAALARARAAGTDDAVTPVADEVAGSARLLALDEMQVTDIADAMILGRLFERLWAQGVALVTTSNRAPLGPLQGRAQPRSVLPSSHDRGADARCWGRRGATDHRQGPPARPCRATRPGWARGRARALDACGATLCGRAGRGGGPRPCASWGARWRCRAFTTGSRGRPSTTCAAPPSAPPTTRHRRGRARAHPRRRAPHGRRDLQRGPALRDARGRALRGARDALRLGRGPPRPPYVEGEGSFEFARTASRLQEMQGAGWGR
jgi:cell division protein ZapE